MGMHETRVLEHNEQRAQEDDRDRNRGHDQLCRKAPGWAELDWTGCLERTGTRRLPQPYTPVLCCRFAPWEIKRPKAEQAPSSTLPQNLILISV